MAPRPTPQLPAGLSDSYPLSSRKVPPHFSLRKSDSYPPSERRSEGQEANGNNGRGPLAGRRPFMPDCFLTAAERSGHQTPSCPRAPLWLRLRRATQSVAKFVSVFGFSGQKVGQSRNGAHIGNDSPHRDSCSFSSDIDSASENDYSFSGTLLRWPKHDIRPRDFFSDLVVRYSPLTS